MPQKKTGPKGPWLLKDGGRDVRLYLDEATLEILDQICEVEDTMARGKGSKSAAVRWLAERYSKRARRK